MSEEMPYPETVKSSREVFEADAAFRRDNDNEATKGTLPPGVTHVKVTRDMLRDMRDERERNIAAAEAVIENKMKADAAMADKKTAEVVKIIAATGLGVGALVLVLVLFERYKAV